MHVLNACVKCMCSMHVFKSPLHCRVVLVLLVGVLLLAGAFTGAMYAAVNLSRDTRVVNNMLATQGKNHIVSTGASFWLGPCRLLVR
jgi:hypothetical protein